MAISVKIADTTYRCVDDYSIRQQGSGVSSTTLNVLLGSNNVPLVLQTAQVLIDGVAFFLGLIQNVGTPEYSTAYETQIFSLSVSSLECLLNFRNVKHNFYLSSAPTYSDVVQWIFDNIIAEENITLGAISLTEKTYTSSLKIVNQKASSVLDDICNKVGNAAWWISADRKFYFKVSTDFTKVVAPTHLSGFKLTENIGALRTSEIIVGASAKITATESNADLIADIAARTGGSGKIEVVESDSTIHNSTKAGTEAVDRLARNAESEKTITCLCHDLVKSELYNCWPLNLTIGTVSISGDFVVVERTLSHRLDSELNIRVTLKNANYFARYGYSIHQAALVAKNSEAAIGEVASDDSFTPDKKIKARADWAIIANEVAGYDAQATASGVLTAKAAYDAAFQDLADYLNGGSAWTSGLPLWLSADEMSVTEEIDGATYEATWNAYYSSRTALQLAINSVANIRADLSNDRQSVTTDVNGAGGDYSFCLTTLSIYLGAADDSAAWTFDAVPSAGITGTKSNANRTYQVTAMSTDDGYVDLTASRSGYASITKRFSISKSKTGAAGTSPTSYGLSVDVGAVQKSIAGVYTPASINVSAKSTTGGAGPVAYAGRFVIAETTDGSAWTDKYTSSADESSKTYIPSAGIKAIRIRLYLAGGTATLLDEEAIPVVSDGATGAPGANAIVMTSATTPAGTYVGQIGVWNGQFYRWTGSAWELYDAVLPTDTPALYLSFDEVPDIPDDPAGITYLWPKTSLDGWSFFHTAAPYMDGAAMRFSAGGLVRGFGGESLHNKIIVLKIKADTPSWFNLHRYNGLEWVYTYSRIWVTSEYSYISITVPDDTTTDWGFDCSTSGYLADIYIGTGAYLTPAIDNSGNGNHGVLDGGAIPIVGVSGKGLSLIPRVNHSLWLNSIDVSAEWTLSFWADRVSEENWETLFYYNALNKGFFFHNSNAGLWVFDGTYGAAGTSTIGLHLWTLRANGAVVEVYKDAILINTLPLSETIYRIQIAIKAIGRPYSIDELVLYPRLLAVSELRGLYLAKSLPKLYTMADYRADALDDDGKLTPSDKQELLSRWKAIYNAINVSSALTTSSATQDGEYSAIVASAVALSVDPAAYLIAVNALRDYLWGTAGVLTSMTTISTVTTGAVDALLAAYRKAYQNLQTAISAKQAANAQAAAPKNLGRYLAAHPTSYNPGDWWTVYDTDDSPIQRGIWYSAAGVATRISAVSGETGYTTDATLLAKLSSCMADVAWCEKNSYGTAANYGIALYFESFGAVTAFIKTLFAREIIIGSSGYIKSANYAETGGNIPTHGFMLDYVTEMIRAYGANFANLTVAEQLNLSSAYIDCFGNPNLSFSASTRTKFQVRRTASFELTVASDDSEPSAAIHLLTVGNPQTFTAVSGTDVTAGNKKAFTLGPGYYKIVYTGTASFITLKLINIFGDNRTGKTIGEYLPTW